MDTHEQVPTSPDTDHSIFRDLRARNERREAVRLLHAHRKQRIERVIEAARGHAYVPKSLHSGRTRPGSD